MEFTDEEKIWLQSISAEIPEGNELTPLEQQLWEKTKPETEFQAQLFQIMASIRFGLNDPTVSTKVMKTPVNENQHLMWIVIKYQESDNFTRFLHNSRIQDKAGPNNTVSLKTK